MSQHSVSASTVWFFEIILKLSGAVCRFRAGYAQNNLKKPYRLHSCQRCGTNGECSHIAMLQTIEQGWLSTDESINSYFEKNILAYVVGYLKENGLLALSEENERILINLKTVLDSYSNARRRAEPMH